jgi:hypothetical protein
MPRCCFRYCFSPPPFSLFRHYYFFIDYASPLIDIFDIIFIAVLFSLLLLSRLITPLRRHAAAAS